MAKLARRVPMCKMAAHRVPANRVQAKRVPVCRVPAHRVLARRVPVPKVPVCRVPARRMPVSAVAQHTYSTADDRCCSAMSATVS